MIKRPLKSLNTIEKETLQKTLKHTNYNIMQTKNILGCSRQTIYRKIKDHNLKIRRKK